MLGLSTQSHAQDLPSACTESWMRYAATPNYIASNITGLHYEWFYDTTYVKSVKNYANGDSIDILWASIPGFTKIGIMQSSQFAFTKDDGTTVTIGCNGDTSWGYLNISGVLVKINEDYLTACEGESIRFVDEIGNATSYRWNDNDSLVASYFDYKTTKADTVKIRLKGKSPSGCISSDSVELVVLPKPVFSLTIDGNVTRDSMICSNNKILLGTQTNNYNALFYNWSTGELSPEILVDPIDPSSPDSQKVYSITVENSQGCKSQDSIVLLRCVPPASDNIPLAFTPNNDGSNDKWEIPFLEFYSDATVDIYDRWGNLVYNSRGQYKAWDGTSGGQKQPVGTYYYIIKMNKSTKPLIGNLLIIR